LQVAQFVQADPATRTDPMTRVFPRMTKCIYKKFGASGTIQTHDALCILPINVINEKGGSKQAESKDDILKWRLYGIFGLDIHSDYFLGGQ
jgi:hypothetical protein